MLFKRPTSLRYVPFACAAAFLLAACGGDDDVASDPTQPISAKVQVVGHRGASALRPEHTLASYRKAIEDGADVIEPDLVSTRDGVLVARHENEISGTTNVSALPQFASRKATKTIDGAQLTGWFTEDFTLAELRTLRARERLPHLRRDNMAYDGQFPIPTFEEILQLVRDHRAATGEIIGVYPETKHPSYFASIGLPHQAPLLALLAAYGYDSADDAMFIQSFEVDNLVALNALTDVRLIQLIDAEGRPADRPDLSYRAMISPAGLTAIAAYADGIGPAKNLVLRRTAENRLGGSTGLVARAHAVGLAVHPWTFRRENHFLPAEFTLGANPAGEGELDREISAFIAEGVDGLFTDNPAVAAAVIPR